MSPRTQIAVVLGFLVASVPVAFTFHEWAGLACVVAAMFASMEPQDDDWSGYA